MSTPKQRIKDAPMHPRGARSDETSGPLSDRERSARYRARKREQEDRVPFAALIASETMRQITEMCEAKGKRQAEVIEQAVAQAYGRFTRRSAKA